MILNISGTFFFSCDLTEIKSQKIVVCLNEKVFCGESEHSFMYSSCFS